MVILSCVRNPTSTHGRTECILGQRHCADWLIESVLPSADNESNYFSHLGRDVLILYPCGGREGMMVQRGCGIWFVGHVGGSISTFVKFVLHGVALESPGLGEWVWTVRI